ncbi:4-hydroxybenzoate octaprenyltransferase [Ahniella affigens]|uniref:4-hydroxybenzoate octaprenyltransferase n=1 Tax=Ahniella affigens TaxID=2021234 RepID=A0A2P1PQH6_9GAMM|nr:4-hydroxybenzoate octaprenyltransferase [Ahniella affigens]AVP97082.1 4-hydroxybenzoate octaprenyltransferase [Ahniella affigens]
MPKQSHAVPSSRPSVAPAVVRAPRWQQYALLMRLDKPIGWLLLLWPTWWGLWAAARGVPSWKNLIIFSIGVILMRSAGCVINDYADRKLDPQVARTRQRPIASGQVSPREALLLFAALMVLAFLLVCLTDLLTIELAFVGAALAIVYPFMKRVTFMPQLWLGAAFGWAVPMAYAAESGGVDRIAALLFLGNVLWSTAYDTIYAMVDRDDDLKAGAKSTAILFGDLDLIAIAIIHVTFLVCMVFAGQQLGLGWPFYLGLGLATLWIGLQHWLIRKRDPAACFRAFRLSHWAGALIFLGMAVSFALDLANAAKP